MPRASSVPGKPAGHTPVPAGSGRFAAAQWRLLTRLPAEVMIATISAQDDGASRTVAEGLAGLDAIAAGRASDSDLVRAVVAAIYSEPEDERPVAGLPDDAGRSRARVLEDCRRVVDILRADADPADAAAYRHWVQQVAVRVCGATRSGGVFGLAGERITASEREFLDELAAALS
jgi:hypothetical protein